MRAFLAEAAGRLGLGKAPRARRRWRPTATRAAVVTAAVGLGAGVVAGRIDGPDAGIEAAVIFGLFAGTAVIMAGVRTERLRPPANRPAYGIRRGAPLFGLIVGVLVGIGTGLSIGPVAGVLIGTGSGLLAAATEWWRAAAARTGWAGRTTVVVQAAVAAVVFGTVLGLGVGWVGGLVGAVVATIVVVTITV